jgi:hypothetical protein
MASVIDLPVYHAKLNGDLKDGKFEDKITFFSHEPEMAFAYVDSLAYAEDSSPLFLNAVVFPCRLTVENLAVVNRSILFDIGRHTKISDLKKFADNFEDSISNERRVVFHELKLRGYDGALIMRDLMPNYYSEDYGFQSSYVSFFPTKQVKFSCLLTV